MRWCPLTLVFGLYAAHPVAPASATSMRVADAAQLADLSLEQLGDIVVTSVSRRPEALADAPASVFVISAEDIRRSGATSLPEALRLAPNLDVARADTNQYAISARGFNNVLANKLLVLIDGRTVYTPLFSGVFWEAQDVLLEDVERIEVISGPGATLWGVNAVHGVINVITRPAGDTQGTLAVAGAGSRERGAAVRHGGKLASGGHYRVYAKLSDRDRSELADSTDMPDASEHVQAGFRADWGGAAQGFILQGDAYSGDLEMRPAGRDITGLNLLARWSRRLASGGSLRVQGYYDRTRRDHPGTLAERLDTFDVEAQHALAPAGRHRLIWGGGYRHARDRIGNSAALAFLPADRDLSWANVFIQDQLALRDDLDLILGAKAESNVYTGGEFLPSARLSWRLPAGQSLWGAASRAVRAPSRIDREFFLPGSPPFTIAGGPDFKSEIAEVYELGYRAQPLPALSYSLTLFHHDYDRLRSLEPAPGGAVLANNIVGSLTGAEGWGSYRVTDAWRLSGGWVLLDQRLALAPGSAAINGTATLGNDPEYWWKLRSSFDLSPRHELDVMLRHYGARPDPRVPAYTAVDARFGWRAAPGLELSVLLQNLFDPEHPEWGAEPARAEFDRAVFFKVRWDL